MNKEEKAAVRATVAVLKERPCPKEWNDLVRVWFPLMFMKGIAWRDKNPKVRK